jgi:ABC-type multidrug transport system fused ATPase/permease subunit
MDTVMDIVHSSRSHELVAWLASLVGQKLGDSAAHWLHPIFHIVIIWVPLALAAIITVYLWRNLQKGIRAPAHILHEIRKPNRLPDGIFSFVLRFSAREQIILVCAGLAAMPVLYLSLELPKIIINSVVGPGASNVQYPMEHLGVPLTQFGHLVFFCVLYLIAVIINNGIKFGINLYKGKLAERLLRQLRLTIFQRWRKDREKGHRTEAIPLIVQEVEPVGNFAGDAFARPAFEGGTFMTIVVFMFMQNPILGMAALTLVPVQLVLIPWFQRHINSLARERVREIRALSGHLGEQAASSERNANGVFATAAAFRRLQRLRWQLYKWKFAMKAINNFLIALTPFFFYAVGGYLVIQDQLSLGALVAVLAAYKDFSVPLRELFKYYQSMEDVRVRYSELRSYFGIADGDHQQHKGAPRLTAETAALMA